jgi:hypothetical protein
MQEPTHTCPKCQCSMEEGYIPDRTRGTVYQSHWVRGLPPPHSFWFKPIAGPFKDLVISGSYQDYLKVITYRCPNCGYLESFAPA